MLSKTKMLIVGLGLVIAGFVFVGIGVNASSVDLVGGEDVLLSISLEDDLTLEEMLTYAINDEYLAQATYQAIIATYGNIKPFSKIVLAEQTHIDMLLPLFATYGIEVPLNNAAANVIVPDSVSSALATGVVAEQQNIAIYEAFLSQEDLPDDVRLVFEQLLSASENHLKAFSRDRLFGAGYDLGQMIQNRFRKGGQRHGTQGQPECNVTI